MAPDPIARNFARQTSAWRIEGSKRLINFGRVPGRTGGRDDGLQIARISAYNILDALNNSGERQTGVK